MLNSRVGRVLGCLLVCVLSASFLVTGLATAAPPASESEATLWSLERSYWRYVQANDLSAYRNLWHKDFLGWPSVSPAPVHKDHITDWITSQTSQGLAFQAEEPQPAGIQVTGDIAVVYYRVTYKWVDKESQNPHPVAKDATRVGHPAVHTIRVTHTWRKEGKSWLIIGGMSMLEPASS